MSASEANRVCAKYGAAMKPGFVLDQSYAAATQNEWIEGSHETSIWTGLKLKGHQCLPVTFRVQRAGYLESYAAPA
jgi:hypothetical protein